MPERITRPNLRRTWTSFILGAGDDRGVVMAQVGQTDLGLIRELHAHGRAPASVNESSHMRARLSHPSVYLTVGQQAGILLADGQLLLRRARKGTRKGCVLMLLLAVGAFLLIPVLLSLAAVETGIRDRARGRAVGWPTTLLFLAVGLGAIVVTYEARVADVPSAQAWEAGLVAAAGVVAVLGLYYGVGRLMRRSWAIVGLWVLSALPLTAGVYIGLYLLDAAVGCAPGAYECPT